MKMKIVASSTGKAMITASMIDDYSVNDKGEEPPRQHSLEQFGISDGVIGVWLDFHRQAEPPWTAVAHDQVSLLSYRRIRRQRK
jgi:hypothetical protein